jgi:hypothetical protein
MLPTSECREERRLRERYNATIKAYRERLAALNGVSTNAEFEDAYEHAEIERLQFVRARFHLRYHIQDHGCVVAEEAAGAS